MIKINRTYVQRSPGKTGTRTNRLTRRQSIWGLVFLSPWLIGLLAFQLLPILATIFLSFTNYNGNVEFKLGNFKFIGFANYARITTDPNLLQALGVTLKFAAIAVPLGLIVPLFFALLVNSKHLIGRNLFRMLFYLPSVIPVVAVTMVFNGVLNAQSGWINQLLALFHIPGPRWFSDPNWAVPALNLIALWGVGNAMIILLAGLQNVPTEIMEAATIDGASGMQRFWYVTIPLISPVIFYNLTLGVINGFQYFIPAMLIGGTNGNPQGATLTYNLQFYREAFVFSEMGYASVMALILFVIVMICTTAMFTWGQRRVYYAGGEK
jgi:multiple sugar transport system permease protein